ncbi:NAD-dependent epimerase/dehydratase family protein [Streptomyces sp. NPDC002994]|uniref:NAD-dependent epimerase/dehydratase family protein n=1 Tax=Streptomyces sp. NPDC002994 TaxID=3154441 RepID=UPI0033A29E6E
MRRHVKLAAGLLNQSQNTRRPLIVVLGASGFLGPAVIDRLAGLPVKVRAVARGLAPAPPRTVADIEGHRTDLARPGALAAAVEGADAVVHLAAHVGDGRSWRAAGEDSEQVNVGLMRDLVTAFEHREAPAPAVVFASTAQAAGPSGLPRAAYARQKMAAEELLREATARGAVRGAVLRLSTVYGRSPLTGSLGRGVLAAMARRALDDAPLTMWHDGTVERDFLHVRDAARAFVTALDHLPGLQGGDWSVGSGSRVQLGDVFRSLADAVAERTGRPPVPVLSVEPPDFAAAGDFHTPECDPAAFGAVTGWSPSVPLHDGLDELAAELVAAQASTSRER